GEHVAVRGDAGRAQSDAGGDRVVVLADTQADFAEVGERVAGEADAAGRGDLHRGGRLAQAFAGGFEQRAAGLARGQEVSGLLVGLVEEGARLLVGVPDVAAGRQPGGVLEGDALEGDVVHRVVDAVAGDLYQRGQLGQLDVVARRVPAGGRLVVQLPGLRVEVPLPALQEGVGVLQEHLAAGERLGQGVVAPVVVVPGRLLHVDLVAGDVLYRREVVGEGVLALHLDPVLLRQSREVVQRRVVDRHA